MPALDLRDAITVVTGIVTLTGVIFALRATVIELKAGQVEVLRQIQALHKRLDDHGKRIGHGEIVQAVLAERIEGLRDTQRMKLRGRVELSGPEVPLFKDDDGEEST